MKIINYKYGYNDTFDCSIHGRIIMDRWEWKETIKYLLKKKYDFRFMLEKDIERVLKLRKYDRRNLRVSATQLIVEKFGLLRYKPGNYVIDVLR